MDDEARRKVDKILEDYARLPSDELGRIVDTYEKLQGLNFLAISRQELVKLNRSLKKSLALPFPS